MIDQSKAVQQQSATGVLEELAHKADDFVRDDDWIERDFVVRVELTQEQYSTLRLALFRDTQVAHSLGGWHLLRALDIERSMSRNEGTFYGQLSFMSPWEFGAFLKWAGSNQNLTIWQVVSQCLTAIPELTES